MIRLTGVSALDTFSYRNMEFDFSDGLFALEGVNGSSKSSLFLTLQQGLFNRNAKGCKVDEVNNQITGQPYEIKVSLTKDGDDYLVVNSRKEGRIDIFKNDKAISMKRIPDNLLLIQEILGCDYSMFSDLTYQNKDSSLDLLETGTDKGRKQFINRVLRLSEIDEQYSRMKEKEKELTGKSGRLAFLRSRIETLESSVGAELAEGVELVTTSLASEMAQFAEEIALLKEEKRCLEFALKEVTEQWARRDAELKIHEKIRALKGQLAELLPPQHDFTVSDMKKALEADGPREMELRMKIARLEDDITRAAAAEEYKERRNQLQKELDGIETVMLREEIAVLLEADARYFATEEAALESIKKQIERLSKAIASGDCPTCGSKAPVAAFRAEIASLIDDEEARKASYDKRVIQNRENKFCLAAIEKREHLQREMERLNIPANELDVASARAAAAKHREELEQLQVKMKMLKDQIESYYRSVELERAMADLKATLSGIDIYEDLEQKQEEYEVALHCVDDDLRIAEESRDSRAAHLRTAEAHNAQVRARKEVNRQIRANNAEIMLQVDQVRKDLEEAEQRLDLVREWLGILGNKGYRVARIDRFLRALNATMHMYSQMICEGRIRASFFITEEGEIDFTITDAAKAMDYSLWSGGEKARVRLVTLFAVLELLETMGSVSFNVLCLDEVFDQLDADGKAGLFRVLEYLKGKSKALYVIAHSELALDLVYDGVIRARKNFDGTTELR